MSVTEDPKRDSWNLDDVKSSLAVADRWKHEMTNFMGLQILCYGHREDKYEMVFVTDIYPVCMKTEYQKM